MSRFDGVYVATVVPMRDDLSVDLDVFQEHCAWLVDNGVAGIVPNGSLGEYQLLDRDERDALLRAAVEAVDGRAEVVPGVSGASTAFCVAETERAAAAGARGVMTLPPTGMRASFEEVRGHVAEIASVGLPVVVYNNPSDTRLDLTPPMLAALGEIDNVRAVKDFSGDVTRVAELLELAPHLVFMCGADHVALESFVMGATGWIAGFANALPRESVDLLELTRAGRVREAAALYHALLPLFRWDARPEFVQAIKLATGLVRRPFGGVRPPRLPLPDDVVDQIAGQLARARSEGAARVAGAADV